MLNDWEKKGSASTQAHAVLAAQDAVGIIASTTELKTMQDELERIRDYLIFGRLPNSDWTAETMQQLEESEEKALQLIRKEKVRPINS